MISSPFGHSLIDYEDNYCQFPKGSIFELIAQRYILKNENPKSSTRIYNLIQGKSFIEASKVLYKEMRTSVTFAGEDNEMTEGDINFGVAVMAISAVFETAGVIMENPNITNWAVELKHNILNSVLPRDIEQDIQTCAYDENPAPCSYGDWHS